MVGACKTWLHKAAPQGVGACTCTHNRRIYPLQVKRVNKMSPFKHQALPEGVQRAKATLRAGRTADTLVMREVDARKAKAADTIAMPWWQMAKRVILNRKKDGLAVSLVKEAP